MSTFYPTGQNRLLALEQELLSRKQFSKKWQSRSPRTQHSYPRQNNSMMSWEINNQTDSTEYYDIQEDEEGIDYSTLLIQNYAEEGEQPDNTKFRVIETPTETEDDYAEIDADPEYIYSSPPFYRWDTPDLIPSYAEPSTDDSVSAAHEIDESESFSYSALAAMLCNTHRRTEQTEQSLPSYQSDRWADSNELELPSIAPPISPPSHHPPVQGSSIPPISPPTSKRPSTIAPPFQVPEIDLPEADFPDVSAGVSSALDQEETSYATLAWMLQETRQLEPPEPEEFDNPFFSAAQTIDVAAQAIAKDDTQNFDLPDDDIALPPDFFQ